MIVVHKKRIIQICSVLCLTITLISIKTTFKKQKIVPTVNLPVTNRVVVLDAGHGKPDERS